MLEETLNDANKCTNGKNIMMNIKMKNSTMLAIIMIDCIGNCIDNKIDD